MNRKHKKTELDARPRQFVEMTIIFLLWMIAQTSWALTLDIPLFPEEVVGQIRIVQSVPGDTLYKIAHRFDLGFEPLTKANPLLASTNRLRQNTGIVIPSFFILPNAPRNGIVVNLPEMRLYYYPPNTSKILTHPVAIGRIGWGTPEISTLVVEKEQDPIWVVPESIQLYSAIEKREILPDIMPPGIDNPLGQYALRLGNRSILIHGTSQPTSIGQRISSGCIRMYPEDIELLYREVAEKTAVYIIDQPFKIGWYQGNLYFEAHQPLEETMNTLDNQYQTVYQLINDKLKDHPSMSINWQAVAKIMSESNGIPYRISL